MKITDIKAAAKGGVKKWQMVASGAVALGVLAVPVMAAASAVSVNFESYTPGVINGQDGWTSTGAAGAGCAVYDHAVVDNTGAIYHYNGFGKKSLRISDAVTSGCFGDQTFAKPLTDSVGETASSNGTFSPGTKQRRFTMQFDFASTTPKAQQAGLHVSVSPDRGDGSRMSYLRFEDGANGIDVFFDDVQGIGNPANFVESQIATGLNRKKSHTVKLTLDTIDGPSNDVVKVWIDGNQVHEGTSWENYYLYDTESATEQLTRIVKTVLFRSSGTAVPADQGKGFLFDNLSTSSGPIPVKPPKTKKDCKGDAWMQYNDPSYKSEKTCEKWVENHKDFHNDPHEKCWTFHRRDRHDW